jgi:WD40 repeat protein
MPETRADEKKLKVFISYSRRDLEFAQRIVAALEARGIAPKIDTRDLPTLEDWRRELLGFIREADAVVFIVSPNSIAPKSVCAWEVEQVAKLNKRLAPIVLERVSDDLIPDAIAKINYLFFDPPNDFERQSDALARALQTDLVWLKEHTRLGELARRWDVHKRPGALLLRGQELPDAERWIASHPRGAPEPTDTLREFIAQSRRGAVQRRNVLMSGLSVGLLIALGLAGLAYWQRGIAIEQEGIAQVQRKSAEEQRDLAEQRRVEAVHQRANMLGQLAGVEFLHGNIDLALKISVDGARYDLGLPPDVVSVSLAGYQLAAAVSQSDWRLLLSGHQQIVRSAAFSPDGGRIVTASDDNTARIWDAATGKETKVLGGHEDHVRSAVFSPDGTLIVTASDDKTARIWDAATGKEIKVLRGHDEALSSAAFSPDGTRIVTASDDNTARIWDIATGNEMKLVRGRTVVSAAFSPDGTRILTASWDKTAVWDAATGVLIKVLNAFDPSVRSAAFSPDGTRVITASGYHPQGSTASIWDIATEKEIQVLHGDHNFTFAAFSPDGARVVTASDDNTARIWDAATGKEIKVLRGHERSVNSAVFSPDGTRVLTASSDNTARTWDAAVEDEIKILRGHEDDVRSAVFSPDGGRIVTASDDNTARIWDGATGKEIKVLRGHEDHISSAVFSPDGTLIVTASDDKTARIWDAATGKEIKVLRGHEDDVRSVSLSPDGTRIVTGSFDQTVRIWDAATGQEIKVLSGHGIVLSAAFSPDGTHIVTVSGGTPISTPSRPSGGGPRRLSVTRPDGADLGCCDWPGGYGPARARGRRPFRCLQPRRDAHRHSVRGQDRAHLGCRHGEGDQGPARARGRRGFRRLQRRRDAYRHGVI